MRGLFALLVVACSSSEALDGPTPCGQNGECPSGYTCQPATRTCILTGGSPDAPPASAADAPGVVTFCKGLATTVHQTPITGVETWTADTAHDVTAGIVVTGTLTIEAGAEVCIDYNASLTAMGAGRVVAEGTMAQPIHITSQNRTGDFFGSIGNSAGGTLRLAHVLFDSTGGIGGTQGTLGLIRLIGPGRFMPQQETLSALDVTISNAPGQGVTLFGGATFTADSAGLTISGAAGHPIALEPRAAGSIPEGSYTGNGHDAILTHTGADAISESTTFHDRGVPYELFSGDFEALNVLMVKTTGGPLVTLTLEPGVTMRFPALASLNVIGASTVTGPTALIALGTAERPIVFTSNAASPAAGDWQGLLFLNAVDPANQLANVRVEYAGSAGHYSPSSCPLGEQDGAIEIASLPPSQFVTQTTIAHSAGHGFVRSWASDTKTDFLATNSFTDVALCQESWPADGDGTCPASPSCPR